MQDTDDSQFHADEGKPHAKAVPGSIPKGHVYIRINAVLVLLTEPGATVGMKTRLSNIKTPRAHSPQSELNPCCGCLSIKL